MTIPGIFEEKLSSALKAVLGEELPADFRASVTPSADLRFGDYQSNAAMVLAKRCRTNPRALAQQVADRIGQDAVCSLEIAARIHQFPHQAGILRSAPAGHAGG